jgi:ATP-dependent Clp protease ATP-binding subunit ClpB
MSEYMESHSVSRLIGSPPGYIGYDEGGQLTEAVRRKPYSIVLFDEVEKAHPEVFNILLQILEDGRLTDNQGRTIDFKNTIIILTSNIGSEYLLSYEIDAQKQVMNLVKAKFKPEFINRIDEIIIFNALNIKIQVLIAKKMLDDLQNRLIDRKIDIEFTDDVQKYVIKHGFNDEYGARPLKRFIQRQIETFIAINLIDNKIVSNKKYQLIVLNDALELVEKK